MNIIEQINQLKSIEMKGKELKEMIIIQNRNIQILINKYEIDMNDIENLSDDYLEFIVPMEMNLYDLEEKIKLLREEYKTIKRINTHK